MKPLQPCLAHPIPTSSSQIVITYKNTYFEHNASELQNYPYFTSPSNGGQGNACSIHFVEFRCASAPPSDIGHPGDVWIDLTPDRLGLYAKSAADWRKWPGLLVQNDLLVVHPHVPSRILWCTKHRVTWLERKFILSDLAAQRAEFSNDEAAQDTQCASNAISRMLMDEAQSAPKKLNSLGSPIKPVLDTPALPNTSKTSISSLPDVPLTSSISCPQNRSILSTVPASLNSNPRSSPKTPKNLSAISDVRTQQRLLDQITDLNFENVRLSQEIVRLREEHTHRRSKGPFRDMILAAVGEAAFSEELLDLAKDATISQLTQTVTKLSEELRTVRASHAEVMTTLSEKLNVMYESRLRLKQSLVDFQRQFGDSPSNALGISAFDDKQRNRSPISFDATSNTSSLPQSHDTSSNPSSPLTSTRQGDPVADSLELSSRVAIEPEHIPSSSPEHRPTTSVIAVDPPAVIGLSNDLASPPQPSIMEQVNSSRLNLCDERSELENHSASAASPTAQTPSLTLLNHSISHAGTIHDPATGPIRKRRLSDGDNVLHLSKIARPTGGGNFRKASPESTPSTADTEIESLAGSSSLSGYDLRFSKMAKDASLSGTNTLKQSLRQENDGHSLLRPVHLDKLYTLDTDRYFCHACFIRSDKSVGHTHKPPSVSFPKTVLSHVLIHHYEKEHADTCKKFVDLWSRIAG